VITTPQRAGGILLVTLALVAVGYSVVLSGAPSPLSATPSLIGLAAFAGGASLLVGERLSAICAGLVAVGLTAGQVSSGLVVDIAAVVAVGGTVGFLLTTGWRVRHRVADSG
jgi:hypothetical protein